MKSSFFEYNVAMSGLFTARGNLDAVSHNVANAAAPGFSRQVTFQRASRPMPLNTGKGMVGTGSEIYGVGQIRDIFLDKKYWAEASVLGEFSSKTVNMAQLQNLIAEQFSQGDGQNTGIVSAVNDFFAKLQDLSTAANDSTYRLNAVQSAQTLASLVNNAAYEMIRQQRDLNAELSAVVTQINSIGQQIAGLNRQISKFEADGSHANDLRDQRARLVDELSKFANVDANETDYSAPNRPNDLRFSVLLNGYDFVNHFGVQAMETVARPPAARLNSTDAEGLYDIYFVGSNVKFDLYHPNLKGQIKGIIDARDGNGSGAPDTNPALTVSSFKGVPYYMEKLNTLARTLALAFNEGVTADGAPIPGVTGHVYGYNLNNDRAGALLFTYDDGPDTQRSAALDAAGNIAAGLDYGKMTGMNFTVNPDLLTDPALLNCSTDMTAGESGHSLIMGLLNINAYRSLFREGKLNDFAIGVNGEIGIDQQHAQRFEAFYGDVTAGIDNQRLAVSGVDLNEEMINMVKNQQMYQAAARLINAIDNIYSITINNLGNF
ncbi:MAG: flagellar hook-associated protein FlgK [Defluviitaleaceae bacterium]|nr:flagellar hook-associated protein FlgK [Defluviitaleaceae bacterium]